MRLLALALALAAVSPAAAQNLPTNCGAAMRHAEDYVRAAEACSDAVFKRNDVDQADAICRVVAGVDGKWWDGWAAEKAKPSEVCPARFLNLMVEVGRATDFVLAYTSFRADRRAGEPKPYSPRAAF